MYIVYICIGIALYIHIYIYVYSYIYIYIEREREIRKSRGVTHGFAQHGRAVVLSSKRDEGQGQHAMF